MKLAFEIVAAENLANENDKSMAVTINDKQIAPCICAKARYALGLTAIRPTNSKFCSPEYWYRVVDYFGEDFMVAVRPLL